MFFTLLFTGSFLRVQDNGGGIYTWTGNDLHLIGRGSKILDNIILNGIGAGSGTSNPSELPSHGIYMDDNTGSVEVRGNTVAFCNGNGLLLQNSHEIDLKDNTIFSNGTQLLINKRGNYKLKGNTIYKNKLFSKERGQMVLKALSDIDDIRQFGNFDNNYYCRPIDDRFIINTISNDATSSIYTMCTLDDWKSIYNFDFNSKSTPIKIPPYNKVTITGKNKFSNSTFSKNINDVSTWSASNNCDIKWNSDEKLDGGSLMVSFNNKNASIKDRRAIITMEIGGVSVTKKYILKFSLLGTKNNRNFQVFLRKHDVPYNDISPRYYCNISKVRTEQEFAFSFPATENKAFLVFDVSQDDSTFFVDNLQLHEADFALTNPDDYIRFEYNASNSNKIVNLNNNIYIDIENSIYQGNITLKPWTSIILLKSLNINPLDKASVPSGNLIKKIMKLNWHSNSNASYFDTDSSINNGIVKREVFSLKEYTTEEDAKDDYQIPQMSPNLSKISSPTNLPDGYKNNWLSSFPNPANKVISITLPNEVSDKSLSTRILISTGQVLEQKIVQTYANRLFMLDISKYPSGLYIIELNTNLYSYKAKIIKQ
ncbi:putative secreted protein (Por secretion system target) [Larkinella arboricola]|uniref:Putative secreted protein (Por secretion system target) n=1 Tax=Larkinella arboricola TaxID=643671 RepID=A0A327WRN1_LARAB|nr:T9SS type A sorting domain-containing protein [Larkinella arboricola]RAJ94596.1 putative secreted protein (Por secretion system target) [Larkinella arboricola]